MYIEKEPTKAVENQKAQKALDKEPPAETKARKELKGMPYADQVKATSPRAQESKPIDAAPKAPGNPLEDLRKLFRDNDLPDKLVPTNVVDFQHDPRTGAIRIQLQSGFSRQFDVENTVTFDKNLSGTLKKGSLSGIGGISRGSAAIVEMSRGGAGTVNVKGKMGPFSKTMSFKEADLPSLP